MKYISLFIALIIFHQAAAAQGYRTNNSKNEKEKKTPAESPKLGKNILTFSPVQVIVADNQGNGDVGIAFAYERVFNNKMLAFRLPVTLSLQNPYYYIMPVGYR